MHRRLASRALAHALLALIGAAGTASASERGDPHFGEVLFHAHQGNYFDALERIDTEMVQHYAVDEPQRDTLHPLIGQAEFEVGDIELHYRMHHRAGRAVESVLQGDVPESTRNEAMFRLARIHFHKGHPDQSLRALDAMQGEAPLAVRAEAELLRANALMALGRNAEAVDVLRAAPRTEPVEAFASYNLGIALMRDARLPESVRQLDKAGRASGGERETLAIRDKANFVLGTMLLEASRYDAARRALDRVRLEGPFSNRALLGAGWAQASAEAFERALVPWSLLAKRDATDEAVQEALLALPYAYSKLGVHGRAAVLYESAATTFGQQLEEIDASMRSIRDGRLLAALDREEIRRDLDWVVRLRELPEAPETFYLIALMASHDFQTGLQNHLDLRDLRDRLASARRSIDAFTDLTRLRRDRFEPLLPAADQQFRALDARMRLRLAQRDQVARRLEAMLSAARPELLASADEQALRTQLDEIAARLPQSEGPRAADLQRRIARLRGLATFTQQTQYHDRFAEAHASLLDLAEAVDALTEQYDAYVRTRQAAVHGYAGHGPKLASLRDRVERARTTVETLRRQQGRELEQVAIRELSKRRDRLVAYQDKARFAFADSYDRAVKARAAVH